MSGIIFLFVRKKKKVYDLTDISCAYIDERDPQHLRMDVKKVAEELHSQCILSFFLMFDPREEHYVERIFIQNYYTVIDNV